METQNKQSISIGNIFPSLLTLIFITLKLTKVIDWSWIWVFSPLLISLGFGILTFLFVLLVLLINLRKIK